MASSGSRRTFSKDVQRLYKTIETSTDGQAAIIGVNEMAVHLSLMPKSGFNAHAVFELIISCTYAYPSVSPDVIFGTPIFHPNIDPRTGDVCLSLLTDWQSCFSLLDIVKAMLYLIENPNFDSPNNAFANPDDIPELETKTKRVLAGLTVNNCRFTPNAAWCEWAIENNCLPTENDETETKKPCPQNELCPNGLRHNVHNVETDQYLPSTSSIPSIRQEELNEGSLDELSICTSETVPSFAKVRYSISGDESSHLLYFENDYPLKVASHRIAIIQPGSKQKVQDGTIYYFAEVWCQEHHQEELGTHYSTLFILNNLTGNEENTEFCQTSRLYPWCPMSCYPDENSDFYSESSFSFNLSQLFHIKSQANKSLTADFCQWAAEDGLGSKEILSGLFSESQRRHSQCEHHLDMSSDGSDSSLGLQELFDICSAETYSKVPEMGNETEKSADESDDSNIEDRSFDGETSSELSGSTATYIEVPNYCAKMHECLECNLISEDAAETVNTCLGPNPEWLFKQTRWSIPFAPRQTAILSMVNIRLPPWRGSNARLLADVCWYCKKNTKVKNLVLLDPMALSPFSPLLNLMHCDTKPSPQLTGVLWMTPAEAISPFYRVPVPTYPSVEERENVTYPRPFSLRFLTLAAFLTNWVAWLSRIESYNSTGLTRFSPLFITNSVAACYLQLLTLGCGQAPVADLWPLWLLRRLLTISLNLSKLSLSLPFFPSAQSTNDFKFFFPFSDTDEI